MSALKIIQGKYSYYKTQADKALLRYMDSGLKRDQISAVRCTERSKVYLEIIELIKIEAV